MKLSQLIYFLINLSFSHRLSRQLTTLVYLAMQRAIMLYLRPDWLNKGQLLFEAYRDVVNTSM
ncbi:hypothetical protein [Legionella pneumophila]|uniref:hypothetical protein n=1 Tax=Legionella pneumophila TaxID=446 RepID=UPI000777385D|nr:hypothetical protein [Legionella pneumophila]